MPVFGNVVRLTTAATSDSAANGSGASTTTVSRVYGSGESTYYYQLSRFVRDVHTVQSSIKDEDTG